VLRGDADFGIGDPTFAAIAQARGGDGVVVGAIVDKVALWGIAAKGAPRRDAPGDFAKARVGSFPRPSTTYTLLKQMADSQHVRGMTIVEVPIGSEVALLESGRADVVMMLEPAASRAVRQGYEIVTSFPRLWGPFAFTGMTSTRRFTSSNPDVVVKLRAGMQEALSLAHSDRGRTTSIAQSLFPSLEKEVVATAVARMLDDQTVPLSFEPTREGWHRATETRIAMGQLPAGEYSGTLLAGS
jgi:NitT/TauT family transport system substrate-binding protein